MLLEVKILITLGGDVVGESYYLQESTWEASRAQAVFCFLIWVMATQWSSIRKNLTNYTSVKFCVCVCVYKIYI